MSAIGECEITGIHDDKIWADSTKVSFFVQCIKIFTFKLVSANFFGFSAWNVDLKVRWCLEFTA